MLQSGHFFKEGSSSTPQCTQYDMIYYLSVLSLFLFLFLFLFLLRKIVSGCFPVAFYCYMDTVPYQAAEEVPFHIGFLDAAGKTDGQGILKTWCGVKSAAPYRYQTVPEREPYLPAL